MKGRHQVLGAVLGIAVMLFVSACGGDNDNNGGRSLASSIDELTTLVPLNDVFGIHVGDFIQVDDEKMRVTAVSGNTLTVERGADDTVVSAHVAGRPVAVLPAPTVTATVKRTNTPTGPTATKTLPPPPTLTHTPVATATVTNTSAPTNTAPPTETPTQVTPGAPTETASPTATPTNTQPPTLTPSPQPTTAGGVCGNGVVEGDETCDDGGICLGGTPGGATDGVACPAVGSVPGGVDCTDGGTCTPVGGDGCATNCTTETASSLALDPAASGATLQTVSFSLNLGLSGSQILQLGSARNSAVGTPDEGNIPVAIRVADINLKAIRVTGIACACVAGKAVPEFGPGVSGSGQIGCGPNGLTDINTDYSVVHVVPCTDPGATPDTLPAHAGLCNGAPVKTFSGGPAEPGSAMIRVSTAIGTILDGGGCNTETKTKVCVGGTNEGTACSTKPTACLGGGTCVPAKGPDGIPCTADDPAVSQGLANTLTQTTGTASASVTDANHTGGFIGDGSQCGTNPCVALVTGHKFDCGALPSSLSGSSTVSAFTNLDQATVQDNVVTSQFTAQ